MGIQQKTKNSPMEQEAPDVIETYLTHGNSKLDRTADTTPTA